MKILIDKNKLLVIENPNIPQLKEYSNVASGYKFSDYDKGVIVYHKKELKIINLKNLGDNMGMFWIDRRDYLTETRLDNEALEDAFMLFSSFDEESGRKYFFIPRIKESEVDLLNKKLEKLGVGVKIYKTDKGFCPNGKRGMGGEKFDMNNIVGTSKLFSFIFSLILIYGKMDIKNGELISIRIQIPLFGHYIKYKEELDNMVKYLQGRGVFMSNSILQNKEGAIYQINSSDYEALSVFKNFYQDIEKIDKILKGELTQNVKTELINFVKTNERIPAEGKEEVLDQIEKGVVKILIVGG